jgi:hypothetical protein
MMRPQGELAMKPTGSILAAALASLLSIPVALGQEAPPPPPVEETTPPPETTETRPLGTRTQTRRPDATLDEEEVEVDPEVLWGVGARSRFIFLPRGVIELFVAHATSMQSVAFGGEVIRRKGNFDIVFGIEYANISPEDGLYQEKGEDPSMIGMYPDYVRFNNFAMLSVDASFIWHTDLTDFMQFRYGAGIGLGFLLGGFTQTDTMCNSATTIDDLNNPRACAEVSGTTEEGDKPPVVPIVNLLIGMRFKLVEQLSLNLEVGFRDVFFVGGGIGYFF